MGALSVMYVSSLASGALYWYQAAVAVSGSGNTTLDMFYSIYDTPQWFYAVTDMCENIVMITADGLLVRNTFNLLHSLS